jgi:glycosyltransferase involved in cell wall biosynthesis
MFKRVDGIETTGDDGRQFAMLYGVPVERIFFATHTVDIEYYRSGVREAATKRDLLRREQSLAGTVFIYVGRLWWGKGLNDLMAAFERVQQLSASEVSLVLVGDGPQELELKRTCVERGLRNVVFAGFRQKDQLVDFYAMSDVFVFPTLGDPYGLVVDEAMAASLPVISSSAAGEIRDRVEEGINGYIVPPEDSEALANSMLRLVDNSDLCERMGKASAEKIAGHTPEQWADDFASIVNRLLHKN